MLRHPGFFMLQNPSNPLAALEKCSFAKKKASLSALAIARIDTSKPFDTFCGSFEPHIPTTNPLW